MSRSTRYLIAGAGISGCLLSRALARRGQRVHLIDPCPGTGASDAAAWLMNPVTGKRFVISWKAGMLLPHALQTYAELERESGLKIFHPHDLFRLFQSENELMRWTRKQDHPEIRTYAARFVKNMSHIPGNLMGGILISGGGRADLTPWIHHFRSNPPDGISFSKTALSPEALQIDGHAVGWMEQDYDKVIFCTGYSKWPWFDWLPWTPAKGEILTVRIPGFEFRDILLKGIFVIPLGQEIYRVGATYEWDDLSTTPTKSAREELSTKLADLLERPFDVIDQHAAVRPILQDTTPAIGLHPAHPSIALFNGLGSKGAMAAPWLADHLADHLTQGTPLAPEVDLARNM